jgi:hypothetical protein
VMLYAPRFGVPGHIGAAGQVARLLISRLALRLAPARLLGKMELGGRYVRIYKLRSYNFANKWLE